MINQRKKILPVIYPPITTFPAYAATLSILYNYEESYDWIFSHYLQIYAIDIINRNKNFDNPFTACFFGDFDNRRLANIVDSNMFVMKEICQYLNLFEVPREFIISHETFVSYLKRCIDLNMYIFSYLDVSKMEEYNINSDYSHDVFIYGYDEDNCVFYVADFPNSKSGKYNYFKCSYKDMEKAFECIINLPIPRVKSVAMIQYTNKMPFIFDYSYVQDILADYIYPNTVKAEKFNNYIESTLNFVNWKTKTYVGIDVYKYLSDFIEFELNLGKNYIDHRLYHAMYDHKEMMIKRIKYFINKGYMGKEKSPLLDEYNRVRDNALLIRNLILKYDHQHNYNTLSKVNSLLEETKNLEVMLIKKIFDI